MPWWTHSIITVEWPVVSSSLSLSSWIASSAFTLNCESHWFAFRHLRRKECEEINDFSQDEQIDIGRPSHGSTYKKKNKLWNFNRLLSLSTLCVMPVLCTVRRNCLLYVTTNSLTAIKPQNVPRQLFIHKNLDTTSETHSYLDPNATRNYFGNAFVVPIEMTAGLIYIFVNW